jgi:hypothetical protein
MADLDAQVTFSGDTDLTITDGDDYELVSVVATGRSWRRRTVEGTYMHGRALLGAVLDAGTLTVQVRCKGDSWVSTANRYQELLPYVTPLSYEVTVTIEGVATTYTCEPADVEAPLEKFSAMAKLLDVTLTIPVSPLVA